MVTGYTLARIIPTRDREVYTRIKTFSEVKDVILTYGEYDIIIKVETESLEELDNFIFNKLRATEGVAATTTLIEAKPESLRERS